MQPQARPLTILLVEDEWLVRLALADELRAAGCRVVEAQTGDEAARVIATEDHIDVLLTDIHLGEGLSGWEVAATFREVHPDRPVIYASGNMPDTERCVPDSRFYNKPIDASVLLNACKSATSS